MRVILKKGSKTPVPHHLSTGAAAHQNPPTTAPSTGPSGSDSSSSSADAASAASSGNVGGGIGASSSSFAVANNKKRGRSPVDDEVQESVPQQSEQKKSAAAAVAGYTHSSSSSGRKRRHLDNTAVAAAGANNQSQHVRFEDQPNYLSPTAAAASIQQALAFCKPSSSGAASASASASGSTSVGSASASSSASGGTNSSRRSKNKKQAGILRPPTRVPAAASATATATAKAAAAYLPEEPQASAGSTSSNMGIPARQLENDGQQQEEEAAYMRSLRGRRGSSSRRSPNPEDDARRDQDPADANDDRVAAFEAPGQDDPANDAAGMGDPATDAREENEVNVLSVIPRSFNAQSRGASPWPSSSSSSSSSASSRRSGQSRSNSPETSAGRGGRRSGNTSSAVNGNGGRKKRSSPLTAGVLSQYQDALKKRGLEMVEQEGDGNCLFRAVSLQVYGDPNNHAEVRKRCMDFMAKNEEHFAQFIPDEPFRTYVARKRILGVHGNNPEIQAFSELFNRPIEIYEPQNGGNPINIFQGDYKTSDDPIRLSYHDGNHYNAIVDPYKPTAGLGLGLPGLQPGLADEMQLVKAKQLSDKAEVDRALKESRLAHDRMYEKKAFAISEMEAADFDLEQAVIQSSLQSYLNEEGRKRSPHHHHHRHLHHHRDRARRQGSTPSPTGHSSYSGGPSHRHRQH